MFPCSYCNGNTTVICTEMRRDGTHRWRRCLECSKTTRTVEACLTGRHVPGPQPGLPYRANRPRAIGERNGASVLTAKDVLRLRAQAAAGVPQYKLAEEYGLAKATVSRIVTRKLWAHLPPPTDC